MDVNYENILFKLNMEHRRIEFDLYKNLNSFIQGVPKMRIHGFMGLKIS